MILFFFIGEKVLCFHGPLLYEAKTLKASISKDKNIKYFIHYAGWNKKWVNPWFRTEIYYWISSSQWQYFMPVIFLKPYSNSWTSFSWDEWVAEDRVLKFNDQTCQRQTELMKQHHALAKNKKGKLLEIELECFYWAVCDWNMSSFCSTFLHSLTFTWYLL